MTPLRSDGQVLIVAATSAEVQGLSATLARTAERFDVIITGVGMVATAARTARALATTPYSVAFNFGICGSFDPALPPGVVVHVTADQIADLGAEDGERFLSLAELGLLGDGEQPELTNADPPRGDRLAALPCVRGITVNTAHGDERSIASVVRRYRPQVESMEGAAFMYACQLAGVPFAQVRAVSNLVERRNRTAWKMREAIDSLTTVATGILEAL